MNSSTTTTPADPALPDKPRDEVPAAIVASQATFQRDLPQLLADHPSQWVAYTGARQVAIGPTKTGLIQQCLREGLDRSSFVVRCIEPAAPADADCLSDV